VNRCVANLAVKGHLVAENIGLRCRREGLCLGDGLPELFGPAPRRVLPRLIDWQGRHARRLACLGLRPDAFRRARRQGFDLGGFELASVAQQGDVHEAERFPPVARCGFLTRIDALFQVAGTAIVFDELGDAAGF
jgi:hypothetical protein